MKNILLNIQTSPRGSKSISIAATDAFVEAYCTTHPDVKIDKLNVWEEGLPEFDSEAIGAKYKGVAKQAMSDAESTIWRSIQSLAARFQAADLIVLGVPMWNFAYPYKLKLLAAPVKNIVLVHGAFVDGSGWKPVYDILVKDGYNVTLVQEPLTSLEEDIAATKRILDRQQGLCILVGHSYGGAVITEAGIDSHVAALVYIAAHAPEEGETEAANGKKFPNASKPLVKTPDGFVFLDPANFPADFAADLPREQAEFMAHAQMLTAAKVFTTPITNPAWKLKPSWYLVANDDRTTNPELERMYAERAHNRKVEVEGAPATPSTSHIPRKWRR